MVISMSFCNSSCCWPSTLQRNGGEVKIHGTPIFIYLLLQYFTIPYTYYYSDKCTTNFTVTFMFPCRLLWYSFHFSFLADRVRLAPPHWVSECLARAIVVPRTGFSFLYHTAISALTLFGLEFDMQMRTVSQKEYRDS